MPTAEDSLDTTAEGEEPDPDHAPSSSDDAQKDGGGGSKSKEAELMDTSLAETSVAESSMDISTDSFENPFLKAPKMGRPLNRPEK